MLTITKEFFRTLWLSVSSADFYRDLYSKYKGYGLKYITMIISITSIIYAILFMYNLNIIREYLEPGADQNNNPAEFILKDWPELQYDGKNLSKEDHAPVYLTTQAGIKLAVIDTAGSLKKDQTQKVPLVFTKDKVILWLGNSKDQENSDIVIGYDKIFGTDALTVDHDFVKNVIYTAINQIGTLAFCAAVPILILARLAIHIFHNLFGIILLYAILWWMRTSPTVQSASRVILFSSGVAEFVTPFVLIIYQPLMPITMFIEYWTVLLAMYAISKGKFTSNT